MPVVALHTVLTPGREADYAAVHERIPDAVAAALREHGVRDWRIWRDGRHVFHLVDVADYAAMRTALRDLSANIRWQATVGPLFDAPDDYGPPANGRDPGVPLLWSLARQLDR